MILCLSLLLLSSLCFSASAVSSSQQYSSGPWGLGVVVPENAGFTDGTRLSWAKATNVSTEVTLPNITYSDYPTLAVESLMAADGSVMQIAAGIYPGNSKWLAYGWYIRDVQAYPQSYVWILNSSGPEMAAGAHISLSIALQQGRWEYRIVDINTKEKVEGKYASTVPPALKIGDQEVFALESYATSILVFIHMGNLTLGALRINGRKIISGWYGYGSWDTYHNPLFVVGGLDPPSYISVLATANGSIVWNYEQWPTSEPTKPSKLPFIIPLIIAGVILLSAILYLAKQKQTMIFRGRSSNEVYDPSPQTVSGL